METYVHPDSDQTRALDAVLLPEEAPLIYQCRHIDQAPMPTPHGRVNQAILVEPTELDCGIDPDMANFKQKLASHGTDLISVLSSQIADSVRCMIEGMSANVDATSRIHSAKFSQLEIKLAEGSEELARSRSVIDNLQKQLQEECDRNALGMSEKDDCIARLVLEAEKHASEAFQGKAELQECRHQIDNLTNQNRLLLEENKRAAVYSKRIEQLEVERVSMHDQYRVLADENEDLTSRNKVLNFDIDTTSRNLKDSRTLYYQSLKDCAFMATTICCITHQPISFDTLEAAFALCKVNNEVISRFRKRFDDIAPYCTTPTLVINSELGAARAEVPSRHDCTGRESEHPNPRKKRRTMSQIEAGYDAPPTMDTSKDRVYDWTL